MKLTHQHRMVIRHSLWALYWGAVAVSGGYRFRETYVGTDPEDPRYSELDKQSVILDLEEGETAKGRPHRLYKGGPLFRPNTNEEKLRAALATMEAQIQIVSDVLDHMAEHD